MTTPRAKFTSHAANACTVEYTDDFGIKHARTFSVRGSYVYELVGHSGAEHQVCERLAHGGVTLMHRGGDLADRIRAEFRKMRTDDRKRANA